MAGVPVCLHVQGVNQLVKLIFSKAQPKRFGNGFMNGPVLAGLVEAYVKAINDGAVPTIATAWQVRLPCQPGTHTHTHTCDPARAHTRMAPYRHSPILRDACCYMCMCVFVSV